MNTMSIDTKPIVEVTEHARVPDVDPGGYRQKKNGRWCLRLADDLRVTKVAFVLTRRWLPGEWPEEFYGKRGER